MRRASAEPRQAGTTWDATGSASTSAAPSPFSLLHEAPGELSGFKSPTVPGDPGRGVLAGLRALVSERGLHPGDIGYLVHGATIAVNTVIQRNGATLGLLVTAGFGDVLEIQRLRLASPFAPPSGGFDFGERRAEMERRWPTVVQDAALRVLESVPAAVRDWGKHQIYERIQGIAARAAAPARGRRGRVGRDPRAPQPRARRGMSPAMSGPRADRRCDVVVVGAGIVGCSAAYFLARRGCGWPSWSAATVHGEQSRKNWGFVRQQGRDPLRAARS